MFFLESKYAFLRGDVKYFVTSIRIFVFISTSNLFQVDSHKLFSLTYVLIKSAKLFF